MGTPLVTPRCVRASVPVPAGDVYLRHPAGKAWRALLPETFLLPHSLWSGEPRRLQNPPPVTASSGERPWLEGLERWRLTAVQKQWRHKHPHPHTHTHTPTHMWNLSPSRHLEGQICQLSPAVTPAPHLGTSGQRKGGVSPATGLWLQVWALNTGNMGVWLPGRLPAPCSAACESEKTTEGHRMDCGEFTGLWNQVRVGSSAC